MPTALWTALLAGALAGAPAAAPVEGELTPQEKAGKRIYFDGESGSGAELMGRVGKEGTGVPASAVTCAGCHGDDGLGRPEGAVEPSVITWSKLTTPYGLTHPDGRKHPAYDERTLARAITDGVDPAGNPLDWTMPRYSMPAEDVKALVAFVKKLETQSDPGVTLASVRLGTVLPARGRSAETGDAVRETLEGFLREVNAGGGINGRRLLLEVAEYDGDAGNGLAEARRLLESGRIAALVAGYTPGAEREIAALAEQARIPWVGPFTPFTPPGATGGYVFYVVAGVREQARALAEHAARGLSLGGGRVAVLHPDDEPLADAARAARDRLLLRGHKRTELVRYPRGRLDPGLAGQLQQREVKAILFLGGDDDLAALFRGITAASYRPHVLVPGVLVSRALVEAPRAFPGRIYVAYPSGPSDEKAAAAARFARMQGKARGQPRLRAAQVSTFTSAAALAEGLRRTGRNLSRDRLVKSLETLVEFETGLAPPLSFGPGRRVGVQGAHVVAVDPRARSLKPLGWRRAD
jgi:ABC-type branched-subunit amino acid transport system substrate-binding protein